MMIESTINRTVAATNGVTTVFPFGYYFLQNQDLVVLKTETATNVVTTLVLNSDYTVTGAADPAGGNVTISPALASGFKITIYRDPEAVQPLDLVPNDALPAGPVEKAFDRVTMILQRLRDLIDRSFRLDDGDVSGASLTIPPLEADKFIRVASDGVSLELATVTDSGSVVSASTTVEGITRLATKAEGVAGTADDIAMTPESTSATIPGRNRLLNGGFAVDQRINSATSRADDAYSLDGWYVLTQTAAITVTQQTLQEDGQPFNIRLTQSQASAQRMGLAQIIEARDCRDLRGGNGSFSARVRCSSSQALNYAILGWTGTADTVTSDVVNDWTDAALTAGHFFLGASVSVLATGTLTPAAATWTNIAIEAAALGSTFNNLIVMVWTSGTAAQNVTLDMGKAKFEGGAVATPFVPEAYQMALVRCQRLLPAMNPGASDKPMGGGGQATTTTLAVIVVPFPVRARIAPTGITVSDVTHFGATGSTGTSIVSTGITLSAATPDTGQLQITVAAGLTAGNASLMGSKNAAAQVLFTGAEL